MPATFFHFLSDKELLLLGLWVVGKRSLSKRLWSTWSAVHQVQQSQQSRGEIFQYLNIRIFIK